jgi:hypothetical protein
VWPAPTEPITIEGIIACEGEKVSLWKREREEEEETHHQVS